MTGQIIVYNKKTESHQFDKNNFYIGRGSVVGNPFTHIKDKQTLAKYIVNSRDEAISKYEELLPVLYQLLNHLHLQTKQLHYLGYQSKLLRQLN